MTLRALRQNSKLLNWKSTELKEELLASSTRLSKLSPLLAGLLMPHQMKGAAVAAYMPGFALLFEQRTGKTFTSLAALLLRGAREVMLVGPKTNLQSTWLRDFNLYCPDYKAFLDWGDYRRYVHGYFKQNGRRPKAVFLTNYEAVPALMKTLKRKRWDAIIYDEAQRLKGRTSENSLCASELSSTAKWRLALTGTPMDKTPLDFFGIMRFVEPTVLGTVWKRFEDKFVVKSKINLSEAKKKGVMHFERMKRALMIAKSKPRFNEDMRDEFDSLVGPYVMRITQEDVGIERAKVTYIPVEMDERQARAYDEMEATMVVNLNADQKLKAPLKITQMVKLQQITGGFIMDEDKEIHFMGRAKIRATKALLEALPKPVVLFCKFRHEVELLRKACLKLSDKTSVIYGAIKDTKKNPARTSLLQAFQRGEVDYLVCQQKTGGVGVDLFFARKAIVYSSGHSFIDFEQMVSRLTYLYQKEAPEFFYLFVKCSIDEDIINSLQTKRKVSSFTLKRLKARGIIHVQERNEDRPEGKGRQGKGRQARRRNLQVRRGRTG